MSIMLHAYLAYGILSKDNNVFGLHTKLAKACISVSLEFACTILGSEKWSHKNSDTSISKSS